MLKARDIVFYYLKTKRGAKTPDYLIKQKDGNIIVEIGGKGKGKEQFKGINIDKYKKLTLSHSQIIKDGTRPLFLAGFI